MDISIFSAYQIQITEINYIQKGLRSDFSNSIPKSMIELLCADKDTKKIICNIQKTANTGQKDEGVVLSYKIDKFGKISNIDIVIIGF